MQCCQFLAGLRKKKNHKIVPLRSVLSFGLAPSLPAQLMFAQTIISEKKKCCADEFLILTLILRRDGRSPPQALLPMSFRSRRRQNSPRLYGLIDSLREAFASSDVHTCEFREICFLMAIWGKERCATRRGVLAARIKAETLTQKGENAVLIVFGRSSSSRAAQGPQPSTWIASELEIRN